MRFWCWWAYVLVVAVGVGIGLGVVEHEHFGGDFSGWVVEKLEGSAERSRGRLSDGS